MIPLILVLSSAAFAVSMFGIMLVLGLYPGFLFLVSRFWSKKIRASEESLPSVSLIVVARNAQDLVEGKLENSLALDYDPNKLEIVFFSDGSTDSTLEKARRFRDRGVKVVWSVEHAGKNEGMNRAVAASSGEVLVFSDVDARLEPGMLRKLVSNLHDPEVGGACGRMILQREISQLGDPQRLYFGFDAWIKKTESLLGSVTSNHGKLSCMKRELFRPIASGVTDDFFICLTVVAQGKRFVSDPDALVQIRTPSRGTVHELERRRRIVVGSLTALSIYRELLNPFKHGLFAVSLICNKLIRRLLGFLYIVLFLSSMMLALAVPVLRILLIPQGLFALLAVSYPLLLRRPSGPRLLKKLTSILYYICLGSYGTTIGVVDFLGGRRVVKWDPVKTGAGVSGTNERRVNCDV